VRKFTIWIIVIVVAILLVDLGLIFTFRTKAYGAYQDGVNSHKELNAREAVEFYKKVVRYPSWFGAFVPDAREKLAEVQAFDKAVTLWDDKQYPQAIDAYNTFLKAYPTSLLAEKGVEDRAKITLLWAENEYDSENYDTTIAIFERHLKEGSGAEGLSADAKTLLPEAYLSWGNALADSGDYQAAADRYSYVINTDPDSQAVDEANAALAELYIQWGNDESNAGRYRLAVDRYLTVIEYWSDSEYAANAQTLIPETYHSWAESLIEEQNYSQAEEVYLTLLTWQEEFDPDSIPTTQVVMAQFYHDWGAALGENKEYAAAIEKYELAQTLGDNEIKSSAHQAAASMYAEWANSLYQSGSIEESGEKYGILLTIYGDTQVAADIPAHVPEALIASGQSSLAAGDYLSAENNFALAATLLIAGNDQPDDMLASAYFGWGQALHGEGYFQEAVGKYQLAQGEVTDPELIASITQAEENSIYELSRLENAYTYTMMSTALENFCENKITAESAAFGLDPDTVRMLVYGMSSSSYLMVDLRPTMLATFHLAACVEKDIVLVQSCPYSGGHTLLRKKHRTTVTIYDIVSGRLVAKKAFYGSAPDRCPYQRRFTFSQETITGSIVDVGDIHDWLETFIK